MYTIELYRIDVVGNSFIKLDEIITYQNLSFYTQLNGYGACTFNLDIYDVKATQENLYRYRTHVIVKKNDTIVWAGFIVKVSGSLQNIDGTISVECLEHFAHLNARFTDPIKIYRQVDAGNIASGLITDAQTVNNGYLGFTIGSIETTQDRDRTYEYKAVSEAIIELTQVINGFDYLVTPLQDVDNLFTGVKFDVFRSLGRIRSDLPTLRIGETVRSLDFVTTADLYNSITLTGSGSGEDIISSYREDTGSQKSYTRRELVESESDVSLQQTLNEKAEQKLNREKIDQYLISITLEPNSNLRYRDFILGDTLLYDLTTQQSTIVQFSGQARVVEIRVEIDSNGAELVTPKLEILT